MFMFIALENFKPEHNSKLTKFAFNPSYRALKMCFMRRRLTLHVSEPIQFDLSCVWNSEPIRSKL